MVNGDGAICERGTCGAAVKIWSTDQRLHGQRAKLGGVISSILQTLFALPVLHVLLHHEQKGAPASAIDKRHRNEETLLCRDRVGGDCRHLF